MPEQLPIDDALLGKFLAGEASPDESVRVRTWLAAAPPSSPEAGQPTPTDFARFEHLWQVADPPAPAGVDTDAAWQAVRARLRPAAAAPAAEAVVRPLVVRPASSSTSYWPVLRIAALLTVALGLGWLGFRNRTPAQVAQLTITTGNQRRALTLPDGTTILLNRHSTVRYPAAFADTDRAVTLRGEAFFEVAPDLARPFRIRAGRALVQVVGTSFSVRAYDASVRVAVHTGKVQFSAGRHAVLLVPNQQASYAPASDTLRLAPALSPNVFTFKTGQLVFDNAPLRDVIQTVNSEYGADIRLAGEQLGDCRLTTRFDNVPLDSVLAILAETLSLRVQHQGTGIVLTGTGCR